MLTIIKKIIGKVASVKTIVALIKKYGSIAVKAVIKFFKSKKVVKVAEVVAETATAATVVAAAALPIKATIDRIRVKNIGKKNGKSKNAVLPEGISAIDKAMNVDGRFKTKLTEDDPIVGNLIKKRNKRKGGASRKDEFASKKITPLIKIDNKYKRFSNEKREPFDFDMNYDGMFDDMSDEEYEKLQLELYNKSALGKRENDPKTYRNKKLRTKKRARDYIGGYQFGNTVFVEDIPGDCPEYSTWWTEAVVKPMKHQDNFERHYLGEMANIETDKYKYPYDDAWYKSKDYFDYKIEEAGDFQTSPEKEVMKYYDMFLGDSPSNGQGMIQRMTPYVKRQMATTKGRAHLDALEELIEAEEKGIPITDEFLYSLGISPTAKGWDASLVDNYSVNQIIRDLKWERIRDEKKAKAKKKKRKAKEKRRREAKAKKRNRLEELSGIHDHWRPPFALAGIDDYGDFYDDNNF